MSKKGEVGRPQLYEGGFECIHLSIPAKMRPELKKWIADNRHRFKKGYKRQETANLPIESVSPTGIDNTQKTAISIPDIDFSNDRYLNVEKYSKYPMSQRPTSIVDRPAWDKKKKEYDDQIREKWNQWKLKIKLSQ